MTLYPLFADLRDREVLVVGGGEVAARKVDALLRAGARVCVCAPDLSPALAQWRAEGRLVHRVEPFAPMWLDAVWLVIAATDDPAFNARLAAEARQRRRLANIVDDAALSTFQVPAVVDRDPLVVAISSGGAAPMLARRLREQLETQLDSSWGGLAKLFLRHRNAIRARFPHLGQRRRWYDAVIDGPAPALLRAGHNDAAKQLVVEALDTPMQAHGSTALIAIDGNAEHLTLRALRVMNQADVLLADESIDAGLLDIARRDAPHERFTQGDDQLPERIAGMSAQGHRVVVLLCDASVAASLGTRLRATDVDGSHLVELITCAGTARLL